MSFPNLRSSRLPAFLAGVILAAALAIPFTSFADPQDGGDDPAAGGMAGMMELMKKWSSPGPEHQVLNRFIGEWETEFTLMSMGMRMPASKGSASFTWLLEGRCIQQHSENSMMGMPLESYSITGYDKFRKSFTSTTVSTMDTAMNRFEGDLTRDGKTMIFYGTIDEYLTGELGKMAKGVWRFVDEDTMFFEIHDLAIGEGDDVTQVIEIKYTRKK